MCFHTIRVDVLNEGASEQRGCQYDHLFIIVQLTNLRLSVCVCSGLRVQRD